MVKLCKTKSKQYKPLKLNGRITKRGCSPYNSNSAYTRKDLIAAIKAKNPSWKSKILSRTTKTRVRKSQKSMIQKFIKTFPDAEIVPRRSRSGKALSGKGYLDPRDVAEKVKIGKKYGSIWK